MIVAGVKNNIPVVIGTAGGSGAAPHLEWCRQIIHEIAQEEQLTFTLALIPADVEKEVVHQALDNGKITAPISYLHSPMKPLTRVLISSPRWVSNLFNGPCKAVHRWY